MAHSIEHIKLVPEPVEPGDFIILDDWDKQCNVPLSEYASLITNVKEYDFNKEIAVFYNDEDYLEFIVSNPDPEFDKVFIGNDEETRGMVREYVDQAGWSKLENIDMEIESDGIKYMSLSFGEPVFRKGFYFISVGYQKGWMTDQFREDFSQYELYGYKTDFEKAVTYLNLYKIEELHGRESAKQLADTFHKDFISNFEFGRSLLFL